MATKTTLNSIKAFINTKPIISTDYSNMSFIEERERIQFAVGNIVTDDYFPELKAKCVKVHLDDKEIQKYIILRINDLYNVKDFNISKKYIYLLPKKDLKAFLADIYTFSNDNILTFNSNHKIKNV